jgi:hypothetical protein
MPCTHSCSVFLKAMVHGDERRSKHRQVILRGYICHMPADWSTSKCDGSTSLDCIVQPGDYSQPAKWAAPGVPRHPYLPARPRPLRLANSCRVGCFRHWPCSCFFGRRRWGTSRWRRGDGGRRVAGFASTLHSSFPFLVSWRQRGRRELSLLVFFILVWFVVWPRISLMCGLWYFKCLIKLIMLNWYLSMIWMIILVYISI